jgi:hypothetical protein
VTTPDDADRDDELEALLDAKEAREKAAKDATAPKGSGVAKESSAKEAPAKAPSKEAPSREASKAAASKEAASKDAPSKALAKAPGPVDRAARITLVVAAALALAAAVAAPFQLTLIAETKVKGALVAFFAALALLLSLRALFLRRKSPLGVGPGLIAVVAASLALTAAGFLAFQERSATMEPAEGERARAADLVAWEMGRSQQRSRDLAMAGGLAIPGFALGVLALGLGIGARRKAGAELEKDASDAKVAKGKRRKMVAAGWSALLLGAAVFAAGLAVDVLAILAPVDASPHPRAVALRTVRERTDAHEWKDMATAPRTEICNTLEAALADGTPIDVVKTELPAAAKIADQCVTHRIEQLPKGMACVQAAVTLGASATTKLVHAEERVKSACDGAL